MKPDYVLHCAGGKEIIIEAKATTEQLDNWVDQLASEVNVRSAAVGILWNGTELRLYVSTIPTDYRMNCLEEDIPYRLSVAHQNTAYNQPTQTGFYLGPDKTVNPFLK